MQIDRINKLDRSTVTRDPFHLLNDSIMLLCSNNYITCTRVNDILRNAKERREKSL
jgi:hypothetical protein